MSSFWFGFGAGTSIVLYTRAIMKQRLLFRPYEHILAGSLAGYLMYRNNIWNQEQREKLVVQLESLQKSSYVIRRRLGLEGEAPDAPVSVEVEHRPQVEQFKTAFEQSQSQVA